MITKLNLIFYESLTFVGFIHCKDTCMQITMLGKGKVIIIDVMLVIQQFIHINIHNNIQYNNIYLNNK